MNEVEIKLLNEILINYISEENIDIEDFSMLKKLNDYVIKKHIKIKPIQNYNNRVGLSYSYKYSYDFLKTIDEKYSQYLEKRWNSDTFIFKFYKNNNPDIVAQIYYIEEINDTIIKIPVMEAISDAFAIVHEIMHDINLKDSLKKSDSFDLLCEALSILSEFLFEDYLCKKNILKSDIYKDKREIFYAINYKACAVDFEYFLIEKFLKKGFITNYDISCYLKENPKHIQENITYVIDQILEKNGLTIDTEQRNIIGIFIASYMHDRILQDPKKIKEFIEINDNVNEMNFYDIFKYLDLEIRDYKYGCFTETSYKKLFKSYKNEISRMK